MILVRCLKTKNTPKFQNVLYGVEAARTSMPVQRKIPVHSLLNFPFFKVLLVTKSTVLNTSFSVFTNFDLPFPFLAFTECENRVFKSMKNCLCRAFKKSRINLGLFIRLNRPSSLRVVAI